MFMDFRNPVPPAWPPRPATPPARLTPRQQRWLGGVIAFNLLLMILAPIGGATLAQALVAWLR